MIFNLRPGTLDAFVTREKDYEACPYEEKDVWFDVGANIGAFAVKYHDRVKSIVSFEPEADNYTQLCHHVKANGAANVTTINAALVENDDHQRAFFLNPKKNKGAHSLLVTRGRDRVVVQCKPFDAMVRQYKPNKMKMDIEGGEWAILTQSETLHTFDYIVLEFHRKALGDIQTNAKLNRIVSILEAQGFRVQYREPKQNWQIIIYAQK